MAYTERMNALEIEISKEWKLMARRDVEREGVSEAIRNAEQKRRGPISPEDALKACLYSLEHPSDHE